jgi:hypothetical protein
MCACAGSVVTPPLSAHVTSARRTSTPECECRPFPPPHTRPPPHEIPTLTHTHAVSPTPFPCHQLAPTPTRPRTHPGHPGRRGWGCGVLPGTAAPLRLVDRPFFQGEASRVVQTAPPIDADEEGHAIVDVPGEGEGEGAEGGGSGLSTTVAQPSPLYAGAYRMDDAHGAAVVRVCLHETSAGLGYVWRGWRWGGDGVVGVGGGGGAWSGWAWCRCVPLAAMCRSHHQRHH